MKSSMPIVPAGRARGGCTAPAIAAIVILASVIAPLCAVADGIGKTDPALFGEWHWVGAETPVGIREPLPDQDYRVSFGADGGLEMTLELNRLRTSYSADGRRLAVAFPRATTLAAWLPDSPAPKFLLLIENAAGYFFRNGALFVDTLADGGTLRFERIGGSGR